jgi:hypothetical protein
MQGAPPGTGNPTRRRSVYLQPPQPRIPAVWSSRLAPLAVLALGLLLTQPALAFRCQGKIVKEGDPQARVLRYCGEPAGAQERVIYRSGLPYARPGSRVIVGDGSFGVIDRREELAVHDRSVVEVRVEEWTYNLGPHKLMRLVRFENGLVVDVTTLGYGYHE